MDTTSWDYMMKQIKAERTPLALQVTIHRKRDGIRTIAYAKHLAHRLARDIAPEITFETEGSGDTYVLHINFGLPWHDRKAFLAELRTQPDTYRAADKFFELVAQAEHQFILNIEEVA